MISDSLVLRVEWAWSFNPCGNLSPDYSALCEEEEVITQQNKDTSSSNEQSCFLSSYTGSNRVATSQGVGCFQSGKSSASGSGSGRSSFNGSPGSEPRSSGKRTPLLPLSLEHARFPVRRQRKQPLKTSCFACPDESRAADAVAAHLRYAAESDAAPPRKLLASGPLSPAAGKAGQRGTPSRNGARNTSVRAGCHCRCTRSDAQTTFNCDSSLGICGAMNSTRRTQQAGSLGEITT